MITMARKKRAFPVGLSILGALTLLGLVVGIMRLILGLGATTNLSDAYPWGLWITYDVFFIPFSAGAFTLAATVYIFNQEKYHSIARPAVLAGFLGYILVVLVLLMDLGRWHKFYNILFPPYWNLHSFMFEVSMCITLYTGVLVLELSPLLFERFNLQIPLQAIRGLMVLIASAGIILSSLHQSSLGSLFLIMPYKLHALWWTPLLPFFFFVSSVFSGLSMAIFVTVVSFKVFRRHLELDLLTDLAKVVSIILGIYLVLKVGDLLVAGEFGQMFSEGILGILFLAEMVMGVIVPMVLLAIRRMRQSISGLLWGTLCVIVGLAFNRASVTLLALKAPTGAFYFPHWIELTIAISSVAAGVLVFTLAARFLPVFPERPAETSGE